MSMDVIDSEAAFMLMAKSVIDCATEGSVVRFSGTKSSC